MPRLIVTDDLDIFRPGATQNGEAYLFKKDEHVFLFYPVDNEWYSAPLAKYELLDDCESLTGWTLGLGSATGSISLNTSIFKHGENGINLIKSGVLTTDFNFDKTLSERKNLKNRLLSVWLYIKDASVLAKISQAQIFVNDTDLGQFRAKTFNSLAVGWNRLLINFSIAAEAQNNGSLGHCVDNINYIRIDVDSVMASDTWSAGDVVMDLWELF